MQTVFKNALAKYRVVFLRHGESQWNKENRFTGWHDVTLSQKGVEEAKAAGQLLKKEGFQFHQVYTSVLTRAIQTYNYAAEEMECHYLPVTKSWRLNERHYGALQGLNKSETAQKHGEDQVKIWRRSYDIPPPPLDPKDPRNPANDRRYADVPKDALPLTECLKDTVVRVIPFWHDHIAKDILAGKNVLVVAHGNSLRSIVKYIKTVSLFLQIILFDFPYFNQESYQINLMNRFIIYKKYQINQNPELYLDNVSEKDILELNIPTSVPLVYEFDSNLKSLGSYYLGDQEEIRKKMEAVAKQGAKK